MITEQAKQRTKILAFWEKYGTDAVEEAFGIKRRTLFNWQKRLRGGEGKLESLNPRPKAPKRRRKRIWDERIIEEVKRLRWKYPNLGKDKIFPLLKKFCDSLNLGTPKEKTIGRIIVDLGGLRMFPKKITFLGKVRKTEKRKVMRKPKDFKALYPGHCVAFDTVEKHIDGKRRYIITFEDIFTRFSFAWSTTSHASLAAKEFFDMCMKVFPFSFTFVLTDNGSEFKKYFSSLTGKKSITHFHTYPKTPKMNAHCERLNRSLQEEFIDYNVNLLFDDITLFNKKFADYLTFYNEKRVHSAFKNKLSPLQFMLQSNHYKINLPEECKNGLTYTKP
jgi:transposase InsO family protein